ncbi:hypothetical protein DFJ74DRAFT_685768 [Hyaloraphidium curvatum]|nr:hypothetical protein DFJ74DRAFT_685768 [Hyaloraphidium curvatum]
MGPSLFASLSTFEGGEQAAQLERDAVGIVGPENAGALLEPEKIADLVEEYLGPDMRDEMAGLEGGLALNAAHGMNASLAGQAIGGVKQEALRLLGRVRLQQLRADPTLMSAINDETKSTDARKRIVSDFILKLFGPEIAQDLKGKEGGVINLLATMTTPAGKSDEDSPPRVICVSGNKPWACSVCGQKYKSRGSCFKHINEKHKGVFYKCGVCGIEIGQKADLEKHQRRSCKPRM